MVFQNYALYPHMSVFDNMAFGLKLRHLADEEIGSRVNQAAEVLAIQHLLQRKPKQLSGGQRQRVALGRAIVREPQVFLMDEPLSNLDAKLRVQTRLELTKLHARLKTTVIYVSHDQTEAMTLGNRIAVLRDGVLQQIGAPAEVYAKPANAFVAGFIGSPAMNFFKARLERSDSRVRLRSDSLEFDLPPEVVARAAKLTSPDVILGVRPEDVRDGRHLAGGGVPAAMARIDVVEHMGNENFVHLTSGGSNFMTRLDSAVDVEAGATLPVTVATHKIHLFDPVSELAL
jgi:multiple sugar transport system ATP-binding protein